ncbi:MFS transporter [Candidatus Woesearchaeota archaeon]|nr:MAG: MFS transporter [Candidatus Woesearchaeota archaeon]
MKKNIFFLIAFVLLFVGYDTLQQYFAAFFHTQNITTISFIAIGIIYFFFGAFSMLAPTICEKIGIKKALFFSSLLYPLFILAVMTKKPVFVFIASGLLGIAAAILWTANGLFITKTTTEKNRGSYTGLLFSLMPLGTTIMTFIISFFIEKVNFILISAGLFIVSLAGSLVFLFIKDIKTEHVNLKLNKKIIRKMMYFFPYVFATAFIFGTIITKIPVRITDLFGLQSVGLLLSVYIFSTVIFPFLLGKAVDKFNKKICLILGTIAGIAGFILFLFPLWITFAFGLLFMGISYALLVVISYPMIMELFPKHASSGIALRWVMQSFAVIFAVILAITVSFQIMIYIGIILLIISLLTLRIFKNNIQ